MQGLGNCQFLSENEGILVQITRSKHSMGMLLLVLVTIVFTSGSAMAVLIIAHEDERTSGNSGSLEKLGDNVIAQAGDVLVITAAKSKSLSYVYDITSPDGGVASVLTHQAFDGTKTLDVITYDITSGGTFDFDATPASTSFTTFGAYLLRADYGAGESISLLDSDAVFLGSNAGGINTSSFSFAQSSGIVIDAYSSGSATTVPAGLDGLVNGGNNRITTTGTFTDVTTLSFDWVHSDATKNSRTAGLAYTVAAVPEPSAVLFLSMAGLLCGVLQWRKRHL